MADSSVQTVVIGAGVVGLAVAARLAKTGREVMVLEAQSAIGQGVSSRNSEVIHAGIYYPPGSLKARVCVSGRKMLYEHCHLHGIEAKSIGKLIVATTESEIDGLQQLFNRGAQNGVDDLDLIDRQTALAMQPDLQCVKAIHSPSTGIIDSHALMLSLHGEIENHGGMVVCNTTVDSIDATAKDIELTIGGSSAMSLQATEVINCSGLNAVAMANQTQGLNPDHIPIARFAKGNYFRLQGRTPFSCLIYPAPVTGGLGVHLTLDTNGQARFGPDVQWLEDQHIDNNFNYGVDPQRADGFYAAIRKYWPGLPDNALLPDYAGVRPKIEHANGAEVDFEISTDQQHGIKGLVNLFGIESPGLTSSLAIAEMVCNSLDNPKH